MFDLIATLMKGANARAVETATDAFAVDLIQQRIREAEAALSGAKTTLASLLVRQRREKAALAQLRKRTADLEGRVTAALAAGREELAADGAGAIADLENQAATRVETLDKLDERIGRLRLSIEKAHRRILDLRQSATAARAMDMERKAQARLNRSVGGTDAIHEAEKLIRRVTDQADPFEEAEILDDIDRSLDGETAADRLAEAGFGRPRKTTAGDVLARLRVSANDTNSDD